MKTISAFAAFVLFGSMAAAQQTSRTESIHAACPTMHQSDSDLNERGGQGTGFSQTATTHHFLLKPDGGVIQVEVKDFSDVDQLADVRMHLHHIAAAFQRGDFDIPMFVHDTIPPGEPEMKALRDQIQYTLEETKTGGRVVISSTNKNAVAAIHQFLIFQIEQHKTGDPYTGSLSIAYRLRTGWSGGCGLQSRIRIEAISGTAQCALHEGVPAKVGCLLAPVTRQRRRQCLSGISDLAEDSIRNQLRPSGCFLCAKNSSAAI